MNYKIIKSYTLVNKVHIFFDKRTSVRNTMGTPMNISSYAAYNYLKLVFCFKLISSFELKLFEIRVSSCDFGFTSHWLHLQATSKNYHIKQCF